MFLLNMVLVTKEALVAETAVWFITFLVNMFTVLKGLFYFHLFHE